MPAKRVIKEVAFRAARSKGYLVVDTKKCCGCCSCMLACSLAHEGEANLSLARIQVIQNAFARFPEDIELAICRQCVYPVCVEACPTKPKALHVDAENGNVRTVIEEKCLGSTCMKCIDACPYIPHRVIWNHQKNVAIKCDLCADTPYWNEKGGPDGKQACIEICPMKAIKLVKKVPSQRDNKGYEVNLRNKHWGWLGFPTD